MRSLLLLLASTTAVFAAIACSSNDDSGVGVASTPSDGGGSDGRSTTTTDAGSDAASDAGADGNVEEGDAGVGETCIGYGAGETCATEQGKPYGYVCFDGPPPDIAGCKLTRASGTLGNNYCCEENACVEQIDQGAQCNGVSGKPHRFQCPPTDGGNATPPSGCEEHNSGSSNVEKYYCCP